MAEVFFMITRQASRRGSFTSVKELTAAIQAFMDGGKDRCPSLHPDQRPSIIYSRLAADKGTSLTPHWRIYSRSPAY